MASSKAALKVVKSSLDSQDYDTAASKARELLESEPQNHLATVFLGRALEKNGKLEEAADAYASATKIKPEDELGWKGLCNVYLSQGSKNVQRSNEAHRKLAEIYVNREAVEQAQETVEKLVSFAKENGSRADYKDALTAMLPPSPLYDPLEGRIPHAAYTFTKLAEITENEEKQKINSEIGERRTRIGASLGDVRTTVRREVFDKSDLERIYKNIIDWTRDDELRYEYEAKLLNRAYDHLCVLPMELKSAKREEVWNLAHGMVIVKRSLELAWQIEFEWSDVENLSDIDRNVILEHQILFPDSGLAKIFRGFFAIVQDGKQSEKNEQDGASPSKGETQSKPMSTEERLILLPEGIQDCSESSLAHRAMSKYYLIIGEYESSVESARKALDCLRLDSERLGYRLMLNWDSINADLGTALVYYQSPRNHPEAMNIFQGLLASRPNHNVALLGVGLILEEQHDFQQAQSFLQQALSRDPSNIRVATEAAWCKGLAGDLEGGVNSLHTLVESNFEEAEVSRELKALVYYRLGYLMWELDTDKAARKSRKGPFSYFVSAIKANPELAPAYTSLGKYYKHYAKDGRRARQCFRKAFELSANEIEAAEELARDFAAGSEWDLVELVARRTIDSGVARPLPGSKRKATSWPFVALGVVLLNKQEYPDSMTTFQSAIRIDSHEYHSWVGLGEAYLNSGRYNAARRSLEQALTIGGSDSWFAQYMLANVHGELGEYTLAIQGYKDILESRPDESGVAMALLQILVENARTLCDTGSFGQAIESAGQAIRLCLKVDQRSPTTFNYWKYLAEACQMYTTARAYEAEFPIAEVKEIFSRSRTQAKDLDPAIRTDVSIESLEEMPDSAHAVLASIQAYQFAVAVSLKDQYCLPIGFYNLGWAYHHAYVAGVSGALSKRFSTPHFAIRCFKKAIELEARNADFWNALGSSTVTVNPKVSQHAFVRSLHLNEKQPRTWTNLGVLYLTYGDVELAHQALGRAQAIDPDHALAWAAEGLIALMVGDTHEAFIHFQHAVEVADDCDTSLASRYALTFFTSLFNPESTQSDSSEILVSASILRKLIMQTSESNSYKYILALICERLGEYGDAAQILEEVANKCEKSFEEKQTIDLLSLCIRSKADLSRCQMAARQFDKAHENAEAALDLSEDSETCGMTEAIRTKVRLSAQITSGLSHHYIGNIDESITMFRSAIEESSKAEDTICLLSQVLWKKGGEQEKSVATEQLLATLDESSSHPLVTLLLGAIAVITEDEEMLEPVLGDLQSLRVESEIDQLHRLEADKLIRASTDLGLFAKDAENPQMEEAQTAIMTAPFRQHGWLALSRQEDNAFSADMARNLLEKSISMIANRGPEELAEATLATREAFATQQAIMLCPWVSGGWLTFEELASR